MNKNIIGVDIGGVIIGRINDKTDTSFFGNDYLSTPAIEGAFEQIALLQKSGFEIYLVSKCGSAVQKKSMHWLKHKRFFEITGIAPANAKFCKTRKEKAGICENIGASYFIDDRLEVLSYLGKVEHLFLFNADDKEVAKFSQHLRKVMRTDSWKEVSSSILATKGPLSLANSLVI